MRRLIMAVALMAGTEAWAQTDGPLLVRGIFYSVGNPNIGSSDELVIFAAAGSRQRVGNTGRLTELAFRVHPNSVGPVKVGRYDAALEFDCSARAWRATTLVIRDKDNRMIRVLPDQHDPFRPIQSADLAKTSEYALVCQGVIPTGPSLLTDSDVERAVDRYRASRGA